MPTFKITGPDGKVYRVTAPEGTTPEQALERVRAMAAPAPQAPAVGAPAALPEGAGAPAAPPMAPGSPPAGAAPQAPPQPFDVPTPENMANPLPPASAEEMSAQVAAQREAEKRRMAEQDFRTRLNYGGAQPLRSLTLSLQQLMGQDKTADVERDRGGMEGAGLPGMAGSVAGNIAMLAGPAGAAQTGLTNALTKVAPKLPAALRAALGAAGSAGALESVTAPVGEGETRLGNAATAAATAGALDAGLRGAGKLITQPFKPNVDAEQLFKEGITPPLTTATDSKVGRGLGRITEVFSTAVDESKAPSRVRADQQTVAAMVRRATPPGAVPPTPAQVGSNIRQIAQQAPDQVQDAYSRILAQKFVRVDNQFASRARRLVDTADGQRQQAKDIAHATLADWFTPGKRYAARNYQSKLSPNFDKAISNLERSSDPDRMAAGAILRKVQPLVKGLRDRNLQAQGVDPKVLRELDEAYETAMRLRDASAASVKRSGVTATDINRAVQKSSTKAQFASGEAPNQDLTDVAADLIDRGRVGNAIFNLGVRGVGYGSAFAGGGPMGPLALLAGSRAVQSEPGHKFLLGQYGGQKKLAELLRKFAPGGASIQQSIDTD